MERPTFVQRPRRQAGNLSRTYNIGRRWSKPAPQPASPDPLPDTRLFAVFAVWCEEDIISSTVSNAFAQGCERVFVIDNDSPDGTVAEAIAAGAEVAKVYKTTYYDEGRRMAEIRAAMEEISPTVDSDHVWWLTCDADEFPHGPAGLTLREYLSELGPPLQGRWGQGLQSLPLWRASSRARAPPPRLPAALPRSDRRLVLSLALEALAGSVGPRRAAALARERLPPTCPDPRAGRRTDGRCLLAPFPVQGA